MYKMKDVRLSLTNNNLRNVDYEMRKHGREAV